MSSTMFVVARKTQHMIGRSEEMNKLEAAITSPGDDTRVVVIKEAGTNDDSDGRSEQIYRDGGIGKTRLLEEVLRRGGHPNMPSQQDDLFKAEQPFVISDLLDFTNIQMHTFPFFIEALRQALATFDSRLDFAEYDRARANYERSRDELRGYRAIEQARQLAEDAFFADYAQIAKTRRLVWVLDTAEQLSFTGSEWLLDQEILTQEDLILSTQRRLLALLTEEQFPNTTILMAGRSQTSKPFFEQLEQEAGQHYQFDEIPLENFTRQETREYLTDLVDHPPSSLPDDVTDRLKVIADEGSDQADVLWLYTGGQPVRLALYVDILAEGKKDPKALQDDFTQAQAKVGWNQIGGDSEEEKIKNLQKDPDYQILQLEIEGEFINLLFARTGDLQSQILRKLVQAKRPLNKHQLHFLLNAPPGETMEEKWLSDENGEDLAQIQATMTSMQPLSFVKVTQDGRLFLQDEMYRIYDEFAAANEIFLIDEIDQRQDLYRKLLAFTRYDLNRLQAQKAKYRTDDEKNWRWETPGRALSIRVPRLTDHDNKVRANLNRQLRRTGLDRLHYELRLDPIRALNDIYLDVTEERGFAHDWEGYAQIQAEVRRFLSDDLVPNFIPDSLLEHFSQRSLLWEALQRTAKQLEVAGWIKRFALAGGEKYQRAIDFNEQVEKLITTLPGETSQTLGWTLRHTFSKGERTTWTEFACIHIGKDISGALTRLRQAISDMEQLLTKEGLPELGEAGFIDHPAENRLRRIIGVAFSTLGLGYAYYGQYREAAKADAEALAHFRKTNFLVQKAVTLNNLSRVLSEIGRTTRSVRICLDGLELKQAIGDEGPIAISHNTLALIYNNNLQPEKAWPEAAKAVVYFKKLEDQRGLGLSLLQLGEALRRLAFSNQTLLDLPEQILGEAKEATKDALDIFSDSPEGMRYIEAEIEMGSLFRDLMRFQQDKENTTEDSWRDDHDNAIAMFKDAVDLSTKKDLPPHKLDAQVNLAWTYYYAGAAASAEEMYMQILDELKDEPFILKADQPPPIPDEIDKTYAFYHLGKLFAVKGRVELDRFVQFVDIIKQEHPEGSPEERVELVKQRPDALQSLQNAAEAFVLALGHAYLFSPRSPGIGVAFDQLYGYLKKFNIQELELFYRHQHEARIKYRVDEIQSEKLANIDIFMEQSFGASLFTGLEEDDNA